MITNVPFNQTNPTANSARNAPSLSTQLSNINNELAKIEDTIAQGYYRDSNTVTFVSTTSFTVLSDRSGVYTAGRIVRFNASGTIFYSTVASSNYNSGTNLTTVVVNSTVVPNPLNTVDIGIFAQGYTNPSAQGQILVGATITDDTNNVTAKSLKSATTHVDVSAATAPTSGQVLTAANGTTASWQTPTVVSSGLLQQVQQSTTIVNATNATTSYIVAFSVTATTVGTTNLLLMGSLLWYGSNTGGFSNYADFYLDGTLQGTGTNFTYDIAVANKALSSSFQMWIPGVAAGSHTITLRYKTNSVSNTATVGGGNLIAMVYNA